MYSWAVKGSALKELQLEARRKEARTAAVVYSGKQAVCNRKYLPRADEGDPVLEHRRAVRANLAGDFVLTRDRQFLERCQEVSVQDPF